MVAVPDGAVPVVAVDFGQSLFRPKHFFEFGQIRLRPISTSANFEMLNYGPRKRKKKERKKRRQIISW